MTITRRRVVAGALASTALAGAIRPAGAIIIQDSTWRAEGGRPGRERDGFRAHIALANQPQFDSLVALSKDNGQEWNDASGTWLGNFGGVGHVLSAAHVYGGGAHVGTYLLRTQGGTVLRGTRLVTHPDYKGENHDGYDVAVVRLDRPVTDGGSPPLLYAGEVRIGTRIVMVGFGSRGLGSTGEQDVYDWPQSNKTAAENTVDKVTNPDPEPDDDVDDGDAGNWLRVTLRPESEGGSRLDGILGGGDSGGSAWMRLNGRWVVVGVNVSGGEKYGEESYFARLYGIRPWLSGVLPGLRFIP
jgi:hypothetical protein